MVHFPTSALSDPSSALKIHAMLIPVLHSAPSLTAVNPLFNVEQVKHHFNNVEDCQKYSRGGKKLAPVTKQ